QNLRLEFGAMTPAHDLLGVFHGVHLNSLVDTILAAYTAEFKKGVAGRLRKAFRHRLPRRRTAVH
ncbi:hypothetical protein, partial [Polaromonas sp. AET17H-212]|uniref:hypothetical protein n=1 Tax=Polaromonas sp. AET17H-212 TaxID=1977061 RepID=UPI001C3F0245